MITDPVAVCMGRIVATDGVLGGKPRIEGRRISVLDVKDWIDDGRSPTRIAADFDLDLADVYRALAYYHEHPEEIREWREREAELERKLREREITGLEDLPADVEPGTDSVPSA